MAFDFWADQFVPPFRDVAHGRLAGCLVPCPGRAARGGLSAAAQHLAARHARHRGRAGRDAGTRPRARSAGPAASWAGDPYELRIVAPPATRSWNVREVSVSPEDVAAGVSATFRQDGLARSGLA